MQYRTGTVSVTNGSATVTGDISFWVAEVEPGDLFLIQGENTSYEVASVASNTQLTLTAPYGGTTGTGKAYVIARDFTPTHNLPVVGAGDVETATINKRAWMIADTLFLSSENDGAGSGLDADLLDGVDGSGYARLAQSNTFTGSTQRVSNTGGPRLVLDDSDAATDEKSWFVISQSGLFTLYAATDANPTSTSGATAAIQANRTGTTVDSITLTATALTLSGNTTVSGTFNSLNAQIDGTAPRLVINETDQSADERVLMLQNSSKAFAITFRSDDLTSASRAILTAARGTGSAVTSVAIGNSTDAAPIRLNGPARSDNGSASAPSYSFANDIDAGWYLNAGGDVRLAVGGVDKIAVGTVYSPNLQLRFLTNPIITNVDPIQWYEETDAPADNRIWYTRANSQQFRAGAYDDAISGTGIWLSVERTGSVIDSIAFSTTSAGAITLDTGELQFVQSDGIITRNSNSGRVVAAGGDGNNVANGAVLRLEGIDFGGAGTGGNAQLMASSGKTLSLTATSGTVTVTGSTIDLISSATKTNSTSITSKSVTTSVVAALQVTGSGAPDSSISHTRATASNAAPTYYGNKARGSVGALATVSADDNLFIIRASGHDGTNFVNAGEITFEVDGTPGANSMPGRMVFAVTPSGSNTAVEAIRISNDRKISLSTGSASGSTLGYPLNITSTSPGLLFDESDAPANEGLWYDLYSGGARRVGVYSDAFTSTDYMEVDRTGATVDSIAFTATTITLNGVASSNFARLEQANTFTGSQAISSTLPHLRLNETDAGVDEKNYLIRNSSGVLSIGTATDASPTSLANAAITIGRTGTTVTSISLAATDVVATGKFKATGNVGFNNVTPIAKPTVSGSRGGNAALASLLTALANYGLVTDSTTA